MTRKVAEPPSDPLQRSTGLYDHFLRAFSLKRSLRATAFSVLAQTS